MAVNSQLSSAMSSLTVMDLSKQLTQTYLQPFLLKIIAENDGVLIRNKADRNILVVLWQRILFHSTTTATQYIFSLGDLSKTQSSHTQSLASSCLHMYYSFENVQCHTIKSHTGKGFEKHNSSLKLWTMVVANVYYINMNIVNTLAFSHDAIPQSYGRQLVSYLCSLSWYSQSLMYSW